MKAKKILTALLLALFITSCYIADGEPYREVIEEASSATDTRPIYLWPLLCTFLGDLSTTHIKGGNLDPDCNGPAGLSGIASADMLCETRYPTDAGTEEERNRLEGLLSPSPRHRAFIAGDSQDPKDDFDISNKENRAVRSLTTISGASYNPARGRLVADSYGDLFDLKKGLRKAILSGHSVGGLISRFWTGMEFTLGDLSRPEDDRYIGNSKNCDNWSNATDAKEGTYGSLKAKRENDVKRLGSITETTSPQAADCDSRDARHRSRLAIGILCISY